MLGENIKSARESKGMTQQELADRLNVVRQTVSKWEKNLSVPDADLLNKIGTILNVDIMILLDGKCADEKSEIQREGLKMRRSSSIVFGVAIVVLCIVVTLVIWGILFSNTGITETTTDAFVTPI